MFRSKIFIPVALLFAITGCDKTEPLTGSEAKVAFLSIVNVNATGRGVNFQLDGVRKNPNAVIALNSQILGQYVGFDPASAHSASVRDTLAAANNAEQASASVTGSANAAYTLYIYDTLVSGKFKTLLLNSNRTLYPDTINTANVRFLNLSPRSAAVDAWMIRLVGGVKTDSVNISPAAPYVGNTTPNIAALSTYRNIRANQALGANGAGSPATTYTIRITPAGNPAAQFVAAATTIVPGRNYTIVARGLATPTTIPGLSQFTDN